MSSLLWEASWKSTLILGGALATTGLLRRRSASWRHLVLATAVVAILSGAAGMAVLPHWNVTVPAWVPIPPPEQLPSPDLTGLVAIPASSPAPARLPHPASAVQIHPNPAPVARSHSPVISAANIVFWLWAVGVAIISFQLLLVMRRLHRTRRDSTPMPHQELRDFLASASAELGIGRRIALLVSETVQVPIAWGVLRPVILVPPSFGQFSATEYRPVLYHELEHIRRWDSMIRTLCEITCALLWFQPLVWIVRRRVREEQELACDDSVLARGTKPSAYAGVLLEWQGRLTGDDHLVAVGVTGKSSLNHRLRAILDPRKKRGRVPTPGVALVWLAGLGLTGSLGTLTFAGAIPSFPGLRSVQQVFSSPVSTPILLAQAVPPARESRAPAVASAISGRVVADHSDSPAASAEVRFYKTGLTGLAADLETDSDGRFSAPELDPGEYRLEVSKPGYLNATVRLNLSGPAAQVLARLIRCGAITGQVKDAQGQPVRGAAVFAMLKPASGVALRPDVASTGHMAMVDARGQYRIYNLPPGEYAIAVSYGASTVAIGGSGNPATPSSLGSGFLFYPANSRPEFLEVSGGEEHRGIDFNIATTAFFTVSGKVELPDSKARFWLALANPDQPGLAVAVAQSEPDGKFRFSGISPGSYDLLAVKTGGARTFRGAIPDPDPLFADTRIAVSSQNLDGISVTPGASRSVTLTFRGIAGCPSTAQVTLSAMEDWGAMLENRTSVSAGKDTTVSGLAPARYAVSVSGLGDSCFGMAMPVLDLSGSDPGPVEITVSAAGSVRGKLNTSGRPSSDFAIVLMPVGRADEGSKVSVPDAESHFAFVNLRPGKYRIGAYVAAEKMPAANTMLEFEVRGGAPVEMDLAAPETRSR